MVMAFGSFYKRCGVGGREKICRLLQASVAGALSRDVIFARTQPATYALQAIVSYHK